MVCPSCGDDNPAAAKFCEQCGSRLPRRCPACDHEVGATARFCLECGHRLEAGALPEQPAPAPGAYTPRHLAERILSVRAELEGERKQVTVLFADIKGSTELIDGLDPEAARAILAPAVREMIEAVHRFEGTVCRVMGDGIMALFGAPLAHEDHAARACYAALTMQDGIRRYGERTREHDGVHVLARVGLHSGEVVVGSISNDLHVEYSAIGPTTHLAARMEQLAVPGTVQVTAETLRLAEGLVEVRALGRIPVKGLSEPVEAFELTGAGPSRQRFQAATMRGLTPFIGRQAEMEALQRALDLAGSGHGQIVAPVGGPGVGKSRLLYELVHSRRTQGWTILESGSVSYGKATSWLPVVDLLKAYCRIEARDNARATRERLVGKLLGLDRRLEGCLPALLALLDLPVEDATWAGLDPTERRRQTLDAVVRLLLRESQEQPLVVVFEDLHWIDAETQALLDRLVEVLPTARILLLVNYRPEYTHAWGNKSYYTQLRIDPLAEATAEELLGVLLGTDPTVQPIKPLLVARTDGNPFFLEESVRTLVETGALVGERARYRLGGPIAEVRMPATVQAVLAARIDRLPAEEKRLLQTAAVIGKDVPFPLLRAIAESPEAELQANLARLQAAELVYAVSLFPVLEYTFKHALTHEVAYGSLLHERRKALHARVVGAIEQVHAGRLVDQIEQLARHAFLGEVWEKALRYLRQAGARSIGRSAYREARETLERALVALEHLAETPELMAQAIDIRIELRDALQPLGEFKRAYERMQEAEGIAEALGDQHRLGWTYSYMTWYFRAMGEHRRAIEYGRRALALTGPSDEGFRHLETRLHMGPAYHALGEYRQAIEAFSEVISALESDPPSGPLVGHAGVLQVTARAYPVWSYAEVGAFEEGRALAEQAIRTADDMKHPFSLAMAHCVSGLLHIRQGSLSEAIEVLERGVEQCRTGEVSAWIPGMASHLGYAYALCGRVAEALPLLEEAHPLSTRFTGGHALWIAWLGEAYLQSGNRDDAVRLAERAATLGQERNERGHLAWALRLLAEIAAHGPSPDVGPAEMRHREALALAVELGMRPIQAHCHLGLGKLYRRIGRPDEARAELSTAVGMLREMGMAFWLPEAERELAEAST